MTSEATNVAKPIESGAFYMNFKWCVSARCVEFMAGRDDTPRYQLVPACCLHHVRNTRPCEVENLALAKLQPYSCPKHVCTSQHFMERDRPSCGVCFVLSGLI